MQKLIYFISLLLVLGACSGNREENDYVHSGSHRSTSLNIEAQELSGAQDKHNDEANIGPHNSDVLPKEVTKSHSKKKPSFVIGFITGLVVIILIYFVKLRIKLEEVIESRFKRYINSGEFEHKVKSIVDLRLQNTVLKEKPYKKREGDKLSNTKSDINDESIGVQKKIEEKPIEAITYKYLKGITDDGFNVESDTPDNSFFRIINQEGDDAEFEYFGDDTEAIAKQVFDENCCMVVKGSSMNPSKVIQIEPGKIYKQNNIWMLKKPVKIELK